jgi:hypothetical protein
MELNTVEQDLDDDNIPLYLPTIPASKYLRENLDLNYSEKYWLNYLLDNQKNPKPTRYGGYKIKFEIINGQPYYPETMLIAFIEFISCSKKQAKAIADLKENAKKSQNINFV